MTPTRRVPFAQVDAFTDEPFRGNPAAVCLPAEPLEPGEMLAIAGEMNLSETAFPAPPDGSGVRTLRWFTPTTEVSLCGHATLATAHLLMERGEEPPLRFDSRSGSLSAGGDDEGRIVLDFPADPPAQEAPPPGLHDALGTDPGRPAYRGERAWVVRLPSPEAVATVTPDFRALREVPVESLGVIVTAAAGGGGGAPDFVSRFFGPWVGVDEDPVTGMAHTILGPYWAGELGLDTLRARQISKRGGEMTVTVDGDRVRLAGAAVTVAEGEILVP